MDVLTANDRQGEYPPSWYAATATPPGSYPTAKGELTCDVCVVGGGFTGLSAALHLAQRGLDVVLLEAQRLAFGASGRNGGQVGTGQRVDQTELERRLGKDAAHHLWDLGLESVALVRDLIDASGEDCQWADGIIHADHRERFVPESREYADHLQTAYGYDKIRFVDRAEMRSLVGSSAYHGGTLDMGGGHIHPLRYAFALARMAETSGVRLYENTRVTSLDPGITATVSTDNSIVRAKHVVLGCNGYLGQLEPKVAQRVMPINNFIAATEPLDDATARSLLRDNHAVGDSKFVINYFRLSPDNRMLFGGGESYGYKFPSDIAAKVRKPMLEIFPQLKDTRIDYAWGGTLGITMSRMPHFARLAENVVSTSGYSGHGVAMASLAGKIAAEYVAGQAQRFNLMADIPTPCFPGGPALRTPLLALAMIWYSLRDRL
ncbi:NAD(P)/FAD-dependent oxidoreductase [Qingshengfaniella alkalisoli]|uniref:FAD-binding oxidoreductase n=1 Tax=Qingshengfaniella alkalisoli TaxID=2599296 RepID=A0A5B8J4C4_9RHOB|nr:FAD-binding oxidoreductase [Qingshengfaniella alkalisoli]QDY71558.1 FAD-binding oxidoreductase [Qingshengfaniella alkalisoli]